MEADGCVRYVTPQQRGSHLLVQQTPFKQRRQHPVASFLIALYLLKPAYWMKSAVFVKVRHCGTSEYCLATTER